MAQLQAQERLRLQPGDSQETLERGRLGPQSGGSGQLHSCHVGHRALDSRRAPGPAGGSWRQVNLGSARDVGLGRQVLQRSYP